MPGPGAGRSCRRSRLQGGQKQAQEADRTTVQNRAKTLPNHPDRGETGTPGTTAPHQRSGKRGRVAKSSAENLHEAFTRHETEILLFTRNTDVAFTNNRAERDIRMAKVKQNVSGCLRSPKCAAAYCRISSCLRFIAYKGYNPLTAIQIALIGIAVETIGN